MAVVRIAAPVRLQVVNHLRNALLRQRFVPGERLVERHLCELTGASRASVREALRHLETEGLVVSIPQVGMVVASVSRKDAEAIYAVRSVLEGLAARLFTRTATGAQRRRLRAAADRVRSATDTVSQLQAKEEFYTVLVEGADSAVIAQLLATLHARVAVLRAQSLAHPDRPREAAAELAAIVDAVDSNDEAAAERAAAYHATQAAATIFATELDDQGLGRGAGGAAP